MRIARVALKDFGPYSDVEVLFDQPLSIVRALNASGKTKLAQAIQLSLAEQSFGTTSDGKGAKDKIRLGAEKAVLTLGLETAKGSLELVTTYAGPNRNPIIHAGNGGPDSGNLAAGFKKFLDVSKDRLSCCLDSEFFINEKPADQKAILAALVLPTSYTFDAKMVELTNKHLWTLENIPTIPVQQRERIPLINWTGNPVAIIDQVYGDNNSGVYGARKTAKSTLAGIYIPTPASAARVRRGDRPNKVG